MRNIQRRRKIQERTINPKEIDNSLMKEYSVSEMNRYLRKEYDIDFHNTEYRILKGKAISYNDYLLDIACDIKELLTDEGNDKYFYIDVLLSEFKRTIKEVA